MYNPRHQKENLNTNLNHTTYYVFILFLHFLPEFLTDQTEKIIQNPQQTQLKKQNTTIRRFTKKKKTRTAIPVTAIWSTRNNEGTEADRAAIIVGRDFILHLLSRILRLCVFLAPHGVVWGFHRTSSWVSLSRRGAALSSTLFRVSVCFPISFAGKFPSFSRGTGFLFFIFYFFFPLMKMFLKEPGLIKRLIIRLAGDNNGF